MIVTILWRLAGSPVGDAALGVPRAVEGDRPYGQFSDVPEDRWYSDAVKWAAANGIISGYGDGRFGPEDNITRQELVVILDRYAEYVGLTLNSQLSTFNLFNDDADIADYAKEAIERFFAAGIINGKPGSIFDPKGNATRAEVAAMLMRFIEAVIE
jgi:hypothetical protein